jgi:hypothetical protein
LIHGFKLQVDGHATPAASPFISMFHSAASTASVRSWTQPSIPAQFSVSSEAENQCKETPAAHNCAAIEMVIQAKYKPM